MKIRFSKFIFICSTIVLLLMLAGPITAFCLVDKSAMSFLMFVPVIIIAAMFAFNLCNYLFTYFEVSENRIVKRFIGRKSFDIPKEKVLSITYTSFNGSEIVASFQINYMGKDDKQYFTQFSGNMYNLNTIIGAFKKYDYPVNQ